MSEEVKNANEATTTGSVRVDAVVGRPSKYLKWRHPKFSDWLITEANETRENVAENYIGDDNEPGDLDDFTVEEVEMTEEEFEALPEFEG